MYLYTSSAALVGQNIKLKILINLYKVTVEIIVLLIHSLMLVYFLTKRGILADNNTPFLLQITHANV